MIPVLVGSMQVAIQVADREVVLVPDMPAGHSPVLPAKVVHRYDDQTTRGGHTDSEKQTNLNVILGSCSDTLFKILFRYLDQIPI